MAPQAHAACTNAQSSAAPPNRAPARARPSPACAAPQARDLAVLAAAAYRRAHGSLRVLDVMAGSGVRAARYISQAGADFVWCGFGFGLCSGWLLARSGA
jgi:tRNA G26 N,N-dimethylase Trm1